MFPITCNSNHYNNIGDKIILTNIKNKKTCVVSKMQFDILKLFDGQISIDDIVKKCGNKYGDLLNKEKINDYIHKLKRLGFIRLLPCKTHFEKKDFTTYKSQATSLVKPSSFHTITLQILDICPLKCFYCSQGKSRSQGGILLSFEKIKNILYESQLMGAQVFSIFGGEPLVHPNIVEIIQYAYDIGYKFVEVSTKGTTLNEKLISNLEKTPLKSIQFSVDTHEKKLYEEIVGVKDSYSKMLRGLCLLLDSTIDVDLKIILTKSNQYTIIDTVKFFLDIGVNKIVCEVVTPVGKANYDTMPDEHIVYMIEKELIILNEVYNADCSMLYYSYGKPKQCAGGIASLFVFANGSVGPCDKSAIFKNDLKFPYLFDKTIKDFWLGDELSFMRNIRNDSKECFECSSKQLCLGGCILDSLIEGNSIGGDPMCSKISNKHGIFPSLGEKYENKENDVL